MAETTYHIFDNNTGEEIYLSNDFRFQSTPQPEHRINDENMRDRFGGPAIVNRVETAADGSINLYVDGSEERLNADNQDTDQSYRRS
ncbi:hypothetical protein [Asticcacaulis taihuensis]|jgi:hypothetical protein|uniref:Uncharacterized protein n=1 Tax=Asticcacaulis taihuensis TaxID=260084 RepID=A0A1G4PRK4_9CAUL|nr:hypothetical protein [Asticcacaulis taihuensis]SCW34887.1 hypothetical protein SAMN02927928_0603 [Asticcacaulis taihuensis]